MDQLLESLLTRMKTPRLVEIYNESTNPGAFRTDTEHEYHVGVARTIRGILRARTGWRENENGQLVVL